MKRYSFALMIIVSAFYFSACGNQQTKEKDDRTDKLSGAESVRPESETPKDAPAGPEIKNQKVRIKTDYGNMTVLLYDETPIHRDNFIKLVEDDFYDGTLFHRVISDFMIQGGDPDSRDAAPNQPLGRGGPGYTLEAEILPEFIHKKGALAAARQGDQVNPQRRSSGSQFYIVHGKRVSATELNNMVKQSGAFYTQDQINTYGEVGGTPFLDQQYTVFGEVIDGIEVIDRIAEVPTGAANRPTQDIEMTIELIND
jgi:cyclophilin family peptidyl-prolyl cis-trans isomerase